VALALVKNDAGVLTMDELHVVGVAEIAGETVTAGGTWDDEWDAGDESEFDNDTPFQVLA